MSVFGLIFAICWIPVHMFLLPTVLRMIPAVMAMSPAAQNLVLYVTSAFVLVIAETKFLRKDFDPLCDNFGFVLIQVLWGFAFMLALDMLATFILSLVMGAGAEIEISNPNNESISTLMGMNDRALFAIGCFLAPIAEEIMFRGGVFGSLYKTNRILAYAASMLLFAVYHVLNYAIDDPSYWIYVLQYLPISFVLCRIYERTNSIWASMIFHGVWNYIMVCLLNQLGQL